MGVAAGPAGAGLRPVPAAELVVVGARRCLLDLGHRPDRPPDEVEQQPRRGSSGPPSGRGWDRAVHGAECTPAEASMRRSRARPSRSGRRRAPPRGRSSARPGRAWSGPPFLCPGVAALVEPVVDPGERPVAGVLVDRPHLPVGGPEPRLPPKVSTGSSVSRPRICGRLSRARSSQPVAQTSSKRSASRGARGPTSSGMQWAIPSIRWKRPGTSSSGPSKPKRLITPSTSRARSGRSEGSPLAATRAA